MLISSWRGLAYEAGTDEAGRGCLAGPVTAAAVMLPNGYSNERLNDSKKLKASLRHELFEEIREVAIDFHVVHVFPEEIDRMNILRASIYAMQQCLLKLSPKPELALIDGNRFIAVDGIKHECIVKGDSKLQAIAAASILAKTSRDAYMVQLDLEFPEYGWKKNKGYPTPFHLSAIRQYGVTPHHRMTFNLSGKSNLELF